MKRLFTAFLWLSGVTALARAVIVRRGRFALNLHGVIRTRRPDIPQSLQPHHTAEEFRSLVSWIGGRFPFLTVRDFLRTEKPGVLLTFDDGFANNCETVLPVLRASGIEGLFFVSTQHVRDPRNWLGFARATANRVWGGELQVPEDAAHDWFDGMSEEEVRALAGSGYAVVGSHTVRHPSLPSCDAATLRRELAESKSYLEDVTGRTVDLFAYPYGDYNRTTAEAVRDAGYRAAFAVDSIRVGLPAFEIPRVGIYGSAPAYLAAKLSGLHRGPLRGTVLP